MKFYCNKMINDFSFNKKICNKWTDVIKKINILEICSTQVNPLRILTRKKHPKIKLQRLQKIQILAFGSLVHQINSFQEFLKLEQIFQKN